MVLEVIRSVFKGKEVTIMKKIFGIAALLLVLAACDKNDNVIAVQEEPQSENIQKGIPFSATISTATTKALADAGSTLTATWAVGEKVALIHNSVSDEMEIASVSGGVATITGTITGSPADNDPVTIIYPSSAADCTTGNVKADLLQSGQLGTLDDISANYDVRVGTGNLEVSGTASLKSNVSLTNQFAIFKFTAKNSDGSVTINVKPLTITIGAQNYVITPAAATSELYVALPAISGEAVSFKAESSGKFYACSKPSVSFDAGNYYQTTLKMSTTGALTGRFTINAGNDKVYFSQGNLQATTADLGANWSWAFAANQWDCVGNAASNTSIDGNGTVSANGTVDLFGWVGASNTTWSGAAMYGISNSTTTNSTDTYGNVTDEALKSDWGNTIGSGWRTLTTDEWYYLFKLRASGSTVNGTSDARYTFATINTDGTPVKGIILFPNDVTIDNSEATSWQVINGGSDNWGTKCTSAQWTTLEAKGCVFLPTAGAYRVGTTVEGTTAEGAYWSSSVYGTQMARRVHFSSTDMTADNVAFRHYGQSVRLVKDVQ